MYRGEMFQSPTFRTKFQVEVPIFRGFRAKTKLDTLNRVVRTPTRQRHRQLDRQAHSHSYSAALA